eukprot:GEMP01067367.1.p1 GENE.GEMP01067367.1~~GEMP01067367.1.p1  ORF type:complete len:360 (+),score=115.23 GEMP01067367.1:55-1134(+)
MPMSLDKMGNAEQVRSRTNSPAEHDQNNELLVAELRKELRAERNELLAAEEWAGDILPKLDQLRLETAAQAEELSTLKDELTMWKNKAEIDRSTQCDSEHGTPDSSKRELADVQNEIADANTTALQEERNNVSIKMKNELEDTVAALAKARGELHKAQHSEENSQKNLAAFAREVAKKDATIMRLQNSSEKVEEEKAKLQQSNATLKSKVKMLDEETWNRTHRESALLKSTEREVAKRITAEMSEKVSMLEKQAKEYEQQANQLRNRLTIAERDLKAARKKKKSGKENVVGAIFEDDFEEQLGVAGGTSPVCKFIRRFPWVPAGLIQAKNELRGIDMIGMLVSLVFIHLFLFPDNSRHQ